MELAALRCRRGLSNRIRRSRGAGETLLDEAEAYLRELAANVSPNSLAVIKSEVYRHWSLAMESAFRDADSLMKVALTHPDATEGVKSFVERRAPRFKRIKGGKP